MAFSQTDIDSLKQAIALGAREVRYADGRSVTYRSIAEMQATLQLMAADVAGGPRSLGEDRVASGYNSHLSPGRFGCGFGGFDGCGDGFGGW